MVRGSRMLRPSRATLDGSWVKIWKSTENIKFVKNLSNSLVYTQENLLCMHNFGCMSMKRLGACMRSWVHVYEAVGCMYAELGACLKDSWVHVCGAGCMYVELGACL